MLHNQIAYLYNLRRLKKNQWLSASELENLQFKKLKAVLAHAYGRVGYYRRLFDQSGIKPEDIKALQDITKIPITTRKALQALPKKEITAKEADLTRCLNLRTSGSSGMPLDIFINSREIASRWLFHRRMYFENGGRLTDKELYLGDFYDLAKNKWIKYLHWYLKEKSILLKFKRISIFDDTESQLVDLLEFKPDILRGYASTLKDLAVEIQKIRVAGINPRIIFSTAELISERDREFISSVFKAELFDFYSCNECGSIAWECREHSGYHINIENVIVEFIKDDGTAARSGEEGEIVITGLNSYTMPFIRYKLGDIGVPSGQICPCGRSLPLMKMVSGRANDCIVLADGRKISPYLLTCAIEDIIGIMKYQVLQKETGKIEVKLVKNEKFSKNTISELDRALKQLLSNNIEIEFIVEDSALPGNKQPKFHKVIYRVSK